MSDRKLLVTGSCGFIMSNLVRRAMYEKLPYTLASIDRVDGDVNALYNNRSHTFYLADIRDEHIVDKIFQFEKPDVVIHGAASTHVDYSLTDPNSFITSNVLGTQILINACIKYQVQRFIYIGTDEAYGHLTSESDPAWTEESPINPRNPYSASKVAGELLVKAAHHSHGLTYNITRSSNNYGPRQTPDKLIPKIIKCILNDQKIPIYGQGKQIRDWTHVFDNCAAIMTVLEKGEPNQTYNISANQELSNIEVVQKICNVMGKGHSLIEFVEERPGHDFRYSVDSTKVRSLGWKPQYKFKDGIAQCIDWYLKNPFALRGK